MITNKMNNTKINAQLFPHIIIRSLTNYYLGSFQEHKIFLSISNQFISYHALDPHPQQHPIMTNKINKTKINAQLFPNIISTPFQLFHTVS